MAAESSFPINPAVIRNLSDRSYDKRKLGALEVEKAVRLAQQSGDSATVTTIIEKLITDFTCSPNGNQKKGGLIALAGTAIGLGSATPQYLDRLVPAVLKCFADQEPRVRYYACESMFNITKIAKNHILKFFDVMFIGLCKLFADLDVEVKNGAALMDRLLKDIVADSEEFDVESFIPLLQDHMANKNPYVRALLVGWIRDLDTAPDVEMLDYLPDFLDGLFDMLSDGNREIRQQAYQALNNFLEDIKKVPPAEFDKRVNFRPMIDTLVKQCSNEEKFNRVTAVWWLHQFIQRGGQQLKPVYATLLECILRCISDTEIRQEAKNTNTDLLHLVRDTESDIVVRDLLKAVTAELLSKHRNTRLAALKWISMLLEKAPDQMLSEIDDILAALLRTLSDKAEDVVKITLEVLARLSLDTKLFLRVLNDIVNLFAADRQLLEVRGSFTVRRLCVLLDAKGIYTTLAQILADETDLPFASLMVETLSLILLTSEELTDLREELRKGASESSQRLFTTLYSSWCHNQVATFTLCLLAQQYELAAAVVSTFSESQITVGLLMQVDKLVQLIESPVFLHLRLQLLEPQQAGHANLLRSLYGLLMLLPQSRAFNTLRNRLMSITSLHIAIGGTGGGGAAARSGSGAASGGRGGLDMTKLLTQLQTVQAKHAAARREERTSKQLKHTGTSSSAGAGAGSGAGAGAGDTS